MPSDTVNPLPRPTGVALLRRHLALVTLFVMLGLLGGWYYSGSVPTTYTSTARVLINPSVGNPFVPSATAVRQDELTSMETEAQVASSVEVLSSVHVPGVDLTTGALQRGLQVVVPPNSQILQMSFTAGDATVAQAVSGAVAKAYLANRTRRFDEVNSGRIGQVEDQTTRVISDLRTATAASHRGTDAARSFQSELATALRNELVSLRAQRTALETGAAPAGSVISPATRPAPSRSLAGMVAPVGGALAGLALAYAVAAAMERMRRVVRSSAEVEAAGLQIAAAVAPRRRARLGRRTDPAALDSAVRRLRSAVLASDPRPASVAVAPAATGESAAEVGELLSASFARAGHRAVLVRTSGPATSSGLAVEEGLTEVLVHERLSALEVLQPTIEPLLCVLPAGGSPGQMADVLVTDRVRTVLDAIEAAGNLVVVESPGLDTIEGEAVTGAATLGVVIVRLGRTRRSALVGLSAQAARIGVPLVALVLNRHDVVSLPELVAGDQDAAHGTTGAGVARRLPTRAPR